MRMTIEQLTDEVDMLAAHAEALYKRSQQLAVAIRDNSAEPVPEDVTAPTIPTDGGKWLPNGFSRQGLPGGFATMRAWELLKANSPTPWPKWLHDKTPHRFVSVVMLDSVEFLSYEDKLAATANLGRRWSTIQLQPPMFDHSAINFTVTAKPPKQPGDLGITDPYWNLTPAQRAAVDYDYQDHGALVPEVDNGVGGNGAYSGNWNPSMDADYLFEQAKRRAREVCAAHGANPGDFGL